MNSVENLKISIQQISRYLRHGIRENSDQRQRIDNRIKKIKIGFRNLFKR